MDVGDYAADEAELDEAKAAEEDAGREENPKSGWCHGGEYDRILG